LNLFHPTQGAIHHEPFRFHPEHLALIGRALIALLFVPAGFSKIGAFAGVAGYIASKGVPLPQVAAGSRHCGGGGPGPADPHRLADALGRAGHGDLHRGHHLHLPQLLGRAGRAGDAQQQAFFKNIAVVGGLLALVAWGAGGYSVDGAQRLTAQTAQHQFPSTCFFQLREPLTWQKPLLFITRATATPSAWPRPWPTAQAPSSGHRCRGQPARRRLGGAGRGRRHHLWLAHLHGQRELAVQEVRRRLVQALVRAGWKDKVAAGFTNSAGLNGDKLPR
jgi:putative oxidoreductase